MLEIYLILGLELSTYNKAMLHVYRLGSLRYSELVYIKCHFTELVSSSCNLPCKVRPHPQVRILILISFFSYISFVPLPPQRSIFCLLFFIFW